MQKHLSEKNNENLKIFKIWKLKNEIARFSRLIITAAKSMTTDTLSPPSALYQHMSTTPGVFVTTISDIKSQINQTVNVDWHLKSQQAGNIANGASILMRNRILQVRHHNSWSLTCAITFKCHHLPLSSRKIWENNSKLLNHMLADFSKLRATKASR